MKKKENKSIADPTRRRWFGLATLGGLLVAGRAAAKDSQDDLHFPGDAVTNKVVYQLNKADAEYHQHITFSAGAMLREYGDNIKIVITCFGPGIHVLLKHPRRPVTEQIREKIQSLSDYGVEFHACGNTLASLHLGKPDLLPFAKYVQIGAADLMELQKKGYGYISW